MHSFLVAGVAAGVAAALVTSLACSRVEPAAVPASARAAGEPASSPHQQSAQLTLRLFNVGLARPDPRFFALQSGLPDVELPSVWSMSVDAPGAKSVRFRVGEREVIDADAPFVLSEGEAPGDWYDAHQVEALAYERKDATGALTGRVSQLFSVRRPLQGRLVNGAQGAHRRYDYWLTKSGRRLERSSDGSFVDMAGSVVFKQSEVTTVFPEPEQGHLKVETESGETLQFAFILLVPPAHDPSARYPLLTFLHHGWDIYRGTDNDGKPLETALFAGPRSLISGAMATRHPAVILVPQLPAVTKALDSEGREVTSEWASFLSIDNVAGDAVSAPAPSPAAAQVLALIDSLAQGDFSADGRKLQVDTGRLYLAGHSMGGLGTWDILARFPQKFAAGVPMAGYPDHRRVPELSQTPIWAFHHERDCYNPIIGTQTLFDSVQSAAGKSSTMKFTRLTFETDGKCDQAHFQTPSGAWDREPELFEWLFSQMRARR